MSAAQVGARPSAEPAGTTVGHIDVHAHFLTGRYENECCHAGHSAPDGMPRLPAWDIASALDTMDANGIAAMVLSVSSPGVHFGDNAVASALARHVNESGAEYVRAYPGRFGLSASLPLPDTDTALAELAYALDELNADSIALETNYNGRYLTSPAVAPVLAELDARGAVVTLHPVSPPGWPLTALGQPRPMMEFLFDTTRCVGDLVLTGTITRYPGIRWIIPHAGAALPVLAHRMRAMSALAGEPVDVPGILSTLYYDLAGFPVPVALAALLAITGTNHLLYGSDYPFTPAPVVEALAAQLFSDAVLDPAQRRAVSRGTAESLFPRLVFTC